MPWANIDVPSLALGILRNVAVATVPDAEVAVVHANLDYVDWVVKRHRFSAHDYNFYGHDSYFSGVGDWVFSSALYDDPQWRVREFGDELSLTDERREFSIDLHRSAPEFIQDLADRIVASRPDVVGFTSTFQQNAPALAAARAIKRAAPDVLTVFGGANCDGAQGAAVHRNFDFVDYVVRGEGEVAFPALLTALSRSDTEALAKLPGLCWRAADGVARANPMTSRALLPDEIVSPYYDGFFERLESSVAHEWVEPKLVVEGARGCWWGEKHHCTFCGLNGSFMQFRSKSPARFYDEIIQLVERHQVLDMYVVDNILDMGYLTTLLPRLTESGYDLRLHYEIKSNMRREQLTALVSAGLVGVQPGVENLSARVLKIMDKGVTGCQNVRMLRDAASAGLAPYWNYLYGFPGETPEDYMPLIEQFPAMHHLTPLGALTRIAIERFSPYFGRPELGFGELAPAASYRRIYDLPDTELMDLAYIFSAPQQGIDESVADQLRAAVDEWQREHLRSRLSHLDLGEEIVLVSRRRRFHWTVLTLRDPVEVAAFRLLDQPHTPAALLRKLSHHFPPSAPDRAGAATVAGIEVLLDRWRALGIVFTDAGQYVHVAPIATNEDLFRLKEYVEGSRPEIGGADEVAPASVEAMATW
jgi:ribosomal peptide maturation radical SAM protein 1